MESLTAQALCGVMERALIEAGVSPSLARELSMRACQPVAATGVQALSSAVSKPIKRKVGKYQKRWGKEMEKLKAKHPRTRAATLMKRAHRIVRRLQKEGKL